jgi:hypothetical protein
VGGGLKRTLRLADAIVGRPERGDRPAQRLTTLVEEFVGGVTVLHQRAGAVELLLRKGELGLLQLDIGMSLVETALRLLDLGLGPLHLRREVLGVHAGEHLAAFDHVAFVGQHFGDPPGELGVDIDLVRLDPAVAGCNP